VRAADLNEASLVAEPLHVLQKVLHLTTLISVKMLGKPWKTWQIPMVEPDFP
jgi:hypothetical protein